jgi:hypothetical protein
MSQEREVLLRLNQVGIESLQVVRILGTLILLVECNQLVNVVAIVLLVLFGFGLLALRLEAVVACRLHRVDQLLLRACTVLGDLGYGGL